ncbi:hypothetical protein HanIR_Chr12g0564641 [Helianthus annuus]|nr:hypothetical protein HanIR_Chr12g0564641 [Helianthus annuus]
MTVRHGPIPKDTTYTPCHHSRQPPPRPLPRLVQRCVVPLHALHLATWQGSSSHSGKHCDIVNSLIKMSTLR